MSSKQDRLKSNSKKMDEKFIKISIKFSEFENLAYLDEQISLAICMNVANYHAKSEIPKPLSDSTETTLSFEVNTGDDDEVFNLFIYPIERKKMLFNHQTFYYLFFSNLE